MKLARILRNISYGNAKKLEYLGVYGIGTE